MIYFKLKVITILQGHFRVSLGLCIKTMLSAQPLIWKWFFIVMQIKLNFTRKAVHLASYWKWGILGLGNGLLSIKPRFFSTLVLWTLNEQRRVSSKRLALLLTSFELAGLNAFHVRSTLHQKYNYLSLELGLGRVLSFASRLLLDIFFCAQNNGNLLAQNGEFAHGQMTQHITLLQSPHAEEK